MLINFVERDYSFTFLFLFQVKATDSDCGINSLVNYTMISNAIASKKLFINTGTGEICIKELLDRETTAYYEISVIATDRGLFIVIFILF